MTTPKKNTCEDKLLGFDTDITRRDFIGSTIIGTGAGLLYANAPGLMRNASAQTLPVPLTGMGPDWTGPGGVGDYKDANGNTHQVLNDGHGIRNGAYEKAFKDAIDSGEVYDLVVVGGGFSGLSAAYRYHEDRPNGSVLILDNHAIFGGEAKQNEFDVDGVRLWGPQGSNGSVFPPNRTKPIGWHHHYWDKLGLPQEFKYQAAKGLEKDLKIPKDVYSPMHIAWEQADLAHYHENHGMVMNPWNTGFKDAPIADGLKRDLLQMELYKGVPYRKEDWHHWLDTMTYEEFLDPSRRRFKRRGALSQPADRGHGLRTGNGRDIRIFRLRVRPTGRDFLQTLCRTGRPVRVRLPGIFPRRQYGNCPPLRQGHDTGRPSKGDNSLSAVLFNDVNWNELDRAGQPTRMRLSATVAGVTHDGSPNSAKSVSVIYYRDGKLHKVKAKNVVMASGQWVNRLVCKDLSPEYQDAMATFHHAPMHTINVALRNWKFLEKLGGDCGTLV